mgnify:CR=1 FL=1
MLVLWLYNWDYESVSQKRKLNLKTWWICFSFKKVDRRSAIIHVFTKTPPTQGSQKVIRFMQNEPQFILYRAQRTNVNIIYCTKKTCVIKQNMSFWKTLIFSIIDILVWPLSHMLSQSFGSILLIAFITDNHQYYSLIV